MHQDREEDTLNYNFLNFSLKAPHRFQGANKHRCIRNKPEDFSKVFFQHLLHCLRL